MCFRQIFSYFLRFQRLEFVVTEKYMYIDSVDFSLNDIVCCSGISYVYHIFMISNLYYISCTYVKPMNCMVLGNKQYNTIRNIVTEKYIDSVDFPLNDIVCCSGISYVLGKKLSTVALIP